MPSSIGLSPSSPSPDTPCGVSRPRPVRSSSLYFTCLWFVPYPTPQEIPSGCHLLCPNPHSSASFLTDLGWGLHLLPSSTMGLIKTIITCFVALLEVTNWLILERPFEDEKPVLLMGLKACTCPSLGLSQQRMASHLQAGWESWPGACSRSRLANRGVWRAHLAPVAGKPRGLGGLRWANHSDSGNCGPSAFARCNKPSSNSAKRAAHVRSSNRDSISRSLFGENAFLTAKPSHFLLPLEEGEPGEVSRAQSGRT